MSVLDQVNRVSIEFIGISPIGSAGTTFTQSVDISHFDGGATLCAFIRRNHPGGTFALTLQESIDGTTGWTPVPDEKIIDISGANEIVLPLPQPTFNSVGGIGKLGSFSTHGFLRFQIITTGGATPSTNIVVFAVKGPELLPDVE